MKSVEHLKQIIRSEGTFCPSDELLDKVLYISEQRDMKPREILIEYGATDRNVYIVTEGIFQMLYFNGTNEATFGFAFSGTLFGSAHSFYLNQPAVMQIEACNIPSGVLRIPYNKYMELLEKSHEFARWQLNLAQGQLCYTEMKFASIVGSAEERYKRLLKIRPDIAKAVSSNRLASYLGITPSWLCKLRRKLLS